MSLDQLRELDKLIRTTLPVTYTFYVDGDYADTLEVERPRDQVAFPAVVVNRSYELMDASDCQTVIVTTSLGGGHTLRLTRS
jgi:hypothetical protein